MGYTLIIGRDEDLCCLLHSKDVIKDVAESKEFTPEKPFEIGPILEDLQSELDRLIKRVSGLEQSIEELKRPKE
jgi:hypothetical protein